MKRLRQIIGVTKALSLAWLAYLALAAHGVAAQQGQQEDGAFSMGAQGRMVRGTVTATAPDKLTVKTEEGEVFQVLVTTNTRMMKERQPVKIAEIHSGDGVGAMGVIDSSSKTVHAAVVMVVDAAQIKKLREDMGKTYISGKVLAIDDLELTIKRQDGVTQKIAVDESTSFKKGGRGAGAMMRGDGSQGFGAAPVAGAQLGPGQGGESITLADIKVGDIVIGPGALKTGVFVPTQLVVMDPATMGRRRRGEGGDSAAPAAGISAH